MTDSTIEYLSSPFEPLRDLPEVSSWDFIFGNVDAQLAHKQVFVDANTGEALTHSELQAESRSLAYALVHKVGLQKGDVVVVFSSNSLFFPAMVLATQAAALVCSPANALSQESELAFQIADSGAKAVICGLGQLPVAAKACKEAGLENLFTLEREQQFKIPGYSSLWDLCQPDLLLEPQSIDPEEARTCVSLLCYSSGTTGRPKGVKLLVPSGANDLTHYNITSAILQSLILAPASFQSTEAWIATLPLTHIYALFNSVFVAPYVGIKVVIMNRFVLEEFTANIRLHRATACHIVPPIAVKLAKDVDYNCDFSLLKEWRSGAAPLGRDLTEILESRWKVPVQGLYGMTETTAVIALTDRDINTPFGAVGRLAPSLEAKLVDGELCLKGPNITPGYHNRPDVNAVTFDDEGYMSTGDIVRVDKDGFIYVVDRVKEIIKYNGFQVAPAELEDHLLQHNLVKDAAVVGLDDLSRGTELPLAFVVLTHEAAYTSSNAEKLADIIMDYIATRVASYKRLRGGIIFVTAIPKSPSGKIMRRQLREYANGKKGCLPDLKELKSFSTTLRPFMI